MSIILSNTKQYAFGHVNLFLYKQFSVYFSNHQSTLVLPFISCFFFRKKFSMALKIAYPVCCGIDIHKSFVVTCIASTDKHGFTSYKRHRFSTYTKGLNMLLQWLLEHHCTDVCMESTGKYWHPVFNILESSCSVALAHPKYVRAIRDKKPIKRMLNGLPTFFKHDLVSPSFIPPLSLIRQLRDLMHYRFKLICFKSSEKNRFQNCLTVSNLQLGNIVSDTLEKEPKRLPALLESFS